MGPEPAGPGVRDRGPDVGSGGDLQSEKGGEKTLWILDPGIEYHIGRKSYHEISAKA